MAPASMKNDNYGKVCKPTFGPESATPKYERKTGQKATSTAHARRFSSTVYPLGGSPVGGKKRDPSADEYESYCDFWGTPPRELGVSQIPPDFSPSKALPELSKVRNDEKQLRHDLDEDNRWFRYHNNKKPEKSEFREAARRSQSVLDLNKIEEGGLDAGLKRNFNRFGDDKTSVATKQEATPKRPKRLETWLSPMRVWTPRERPKTPGPLRIKDRAGHEQEIENPPWYDRDPTNLVGKKELGFNAFGFLRKPCESDYGVTQKEAAAEYDRHSTFWDDRRTHWRKSSHPRASYIAPVTTNMEFGFYAPDPETYVPICGPSPAVTDKKNGLPRISLAGGTPGRLNSDMSRFVDNLLLTRPGFSPY